MNICICQSHYWVRSVKLITKSFLSKCFFKIILREMHICERRNVLQTATDKQYAPLESRTMHIKRQPYLQAWLNFFFWQSWVLEYRLKNTFPEISCSYRKQIASINGDRMASIMISYMKTRGNDDSNIYTCVCVQGACVRARAQINAATLQLNNTFSTSDSYRGFQHTECPFYRFPEQGSLVA
jgi:hypothetical protein